MFKRVLVGVESELSGRDAVALAAALADHDGTITLMNVCPVVPAPAYATVPDVPLFDREGAERMLETVRSKTGVDAGLEVVQGPSPGEVLHVQAEARGCDLIVLGSSRHGLIGRAVLGDDTRAALNGAPCAVAIAPIGLAEASGAMRSVGVAYDGSPESRAALQAAKELAGRHNAGVRALRIVTPPTRWYTGLVPPSLLDLSGVVARAEEEMRALAGVEGHAEYGLPGEDLAAFSKEVDLLVCGSRGYGPVRRLVHGSTSNYLQRHARSALLVLPRGHENLAEPGSAQAGG